MLKMEITHFKKQNCRNADVRTFPLEGLHYALHPLVRFSVSPGSLSVCPMPEIFFIVNT